MNSFCPHKQTNANITYILEGIWTGNLQFWGGHGDHGDKRQEKIDAKDISQTVRGYIFINIFGGSML
jgi:hypothetical protein